MKPTKPHRKFTEKNFFFYFEMLKEKFFCLRSFNLPSSKKNLFVYVSAEHRIVDVELFPVSTYEKSKEVELNEMENFDFSLN